MDEEEEIEDHAVMPPRAGETLRAAREAKGMGMERVAQITRITQRHLAMIEAGDFAGLPGRTYAVGFSRSYARAVGLDETAIAQQVREELALIDPDGLGLAPRSFEPGDLARVPTARLAWFSAFAALIFLIGGSVFVWSTYISPGQSLPWFTSGEEAAQIEAEPPVAAEPQQASADGEVVFTASEQIWVRFYESGGPTLLEKEMLPGETFAVPADAASPMLITARPDALEIAIGGVAVPRLAEEQDIMDVSVTAEALLARELQTVEKSEPSPTA